MDYMAETYKETDDQVDDWFNEAGLDEAAGTFKEGLQKLQV